MARVIPPNNRADGDPDPPGDNNNVADMLSLLTGVVAQGTGLFGGSNAANTTAAAALESAQAAGNVPVMVLPSGDTSGTTDQAAIQALLTAGIPVVLGVGLYYIKKPLVMQVNGNRIYGSGGCTPSGDDAGANLGTRIVVTSTFSNPSFSTWATAAIICIDGDPGTGTVKISGGRLRDFWIDGSSSPAGVDGVALYGPANAVQLQRVGVDQATGNAFGLYNDAGSGTAPDGTHWQDCVAQSCGGSGWFGQLTDASVVNCHAQTCGGDGFAITGGNNQFLNCRSDLNTNHGYVIDHPGGSDGFDDYNLLVGCTTQRNAKNGLLVTNSSASGQQYRMPVKLVGCCFTGDGTAATSWAGVWVEGVNQVELTGCAVRVYTKDVAGGCPSIGLKTATIGTGPGSPTAISWDGGSIQCASGGSLVSDSAGVAGALRISPSTVGFTGYASSAVIARTGSGILVAGTVTISNAWVTSSSRIYLTVVSRAGTVGVAEVTARSAGSFTISSLQPGTVGTVQTGDTSTVGWQLVSQ